MTHQVSEEMVKKVAEIAGRIYDNCGWKNLNIIMDPDDNLIRLEESYEIWLNEENKTFIAVHVEWVGGFGYYDPPDYTENEILEAHDLTHCIYAIAKHRANEEFEAKWMDALYLDYSDIDESAQGMTAQ